MWRNVEEGYIYHFYNFGSDVSIDCDLEASKINHMEIGTENKFRKTHFAVFVHKCYLDINRFP